MSFKKKISIFADGANLEQIREIESDLIEGYTFNPSLFRDSKVENYIQHSKQILSLIKNKPVSLEVIADDHKDMIRQAEILNKLSDNVYVKIPITNTRGESSKIVIEELMLKNIKMNITAIFTLNQIENILDILKNTQSILSIFSGRIFDIGIDAVEHTKLISSYVKKNSKCKTLWASPRMVYDIINATKAGCDIITMNTSLIKKINLFGKNPVDYSLDTVKMFYNDAVDSKYEF